MKKLFSLALAFGLCAVVNAQVEDANYAVSMNLGSVLNGGSGYMVSGKYLLGDQLTLTAGFGINNKKTTTFDYDKALWESDKKVERESRNIDNNFVFSVGALYSFRPGERVQPFVGANLSYSTANSGSINENVSGEKYYQKSTSPSNVLGIAGQFGVEYFFAKNISVSAAFDLGINSTTNKTVRELDYKDIIDDVKKAGNYSEKTGKVFGFYTGQTVALNIYF